MLLIFFLLGQLSVASTTPEATVKTQVTQSEKYYVLTRDKPVKFEVSGPVWVRVYTRIPWKKGLQSPTTYKMVLVTDETSERFITKETEYSKVSKIDNINVSKWRSFYIQVPEGKHGYELHLWRAPVDTILLRFSFEAPGRWIDISPSQYAGILELVQNERIIKYYEVTPQKPLVLEVEGPRRLKINARAIFNNLGESGVYTLSVRSNNKVFKEVTYSPKPSETVYFRNRKEVIPSAPNTFYLDLKKGKHRLEFTVMGLESVAINLQVPEK